MGFDRARILVSGAPLPPHVAEFLRIILPNASVFQGYGKLFMFVLFYLLSFIFDLIFFLYDIFVCCAHLTTK